MLYIGYYLNEKCFYGCTEKGGKPAQGWSIGEQKSVVKRWKVPKSCTTSYIFFRQRLNALRLSSVPVGELVCQLIYITELTNWKNL